MNTPLPRCRIGAIAASTDFTDITARQAFGITLSSQLAGASVDRTARTAKGEHGMPEDEVVAKVATFPTPYPEMTGIGPVDIEAVRRWMDDKEEWEDAGGRR